MTLFKQRIIAIATAAVALTGVFSFAAVAAEDPPAGLIGDTNMDGYVTISDATLIQRVLVGKSEKTEVYDYAADVNSDGSVDVKDVTTIQKYLAGYYKTLPVTSENPTQPATQASTAAPTTQPTTVDPYSTDPDGWENRIIQP